MVLLCLPLNKGPRTLKSKVDLGDTEVRPEEKWTFVNGVCAGQYWLQANIDMLSSIFGPPVSGIHNRSYGAVFDIMECVVHRCFSYATKDTRRTYEHLKVALIDQNITKVVVIAHSQGGIILSAALDMLFADLPSGVFEKLEVYTFGCAANHFNNPLCRLPVQEDKNPRQTRHQINYIEHYWNEYDFVARFGTLHFTRNKASNRFVGDVFVNKGQGGHLMNQHYLDIMFSKEVSPFLEQVISVDGDTVVEKEKAVAAVVNTEAFGEAQQIRWNRYFRRGSRPG
ncbi:hypothetical protein BDD12DRAFT_877312 [Trichophaea hybrida]|nr:hypothetical protein BDD12DRAFT_877312 [Trichophaea hybrida]